MRLEKHELVQIGIPCIVVPTKSVTVFKDYSYMDGDGGVCGSPQAM